MEELVSESVVTLRGVGGDGWGKGNGGLDLAWRGWLEGVERAVLGLRRGVMDAVVEAALGGVDDTVRDVEAPIPTVVLVVDGASGAADRTRAFEQLIGHLKAREKCPHVVVLKSSVHGSLASAMKALVAERTPEDRTVDRIMICIEDADKFPPGAIRDLVYTLVVARERALRVGRAARGEDTSLPLGIVTCVCGSSDAFFDQLGVREATMLDVTIEHLPDALATVNKVLEEVIFPRRAGPAFTRPVYDAVMEEFYRQESTLAAVMRAVHMAMVHHFTSPYVDAITTVAQIPPATETARFWEDKLRKRLRLKHLRQIRQLRSVRTELETADGDDDFLQGKVVDWARDLVQHRSASPALERAIAGLWCETKTPPVSAVRKVFEAGMEAGEQRLLDSALRTLRAKNAKQLSTLLQLWEEQLERASRCKLGNWRNVRSVLETVRKARTALVQCTATGTVPPPKVPAAEGKAPAPTVKRSARTRMAGGSAARGRRAAQLAQFMDDQARMQDESFSPALSNVRRLASDALTSMVSMIVPVESLPMYELFAMTSAKALRRSLGSDVAQPRGALLHALQHPEEYDISRADVCEAYTVLSGSGRSVNLSEWLRSFTAVLERQQETPEAINGRFARACADLEYLGFVRHTTRKADRVQRLLFERP